MTRILMNALVAVTAMACWTAAPAIAQTESRETQETTVHVRVLARDAKLIGDAVGGARVTITDLGTGEVLATGVTRGGTGDTDAIMTRRRTRDERVYDTPGAAGWLARLELARPTAVEIAAEGPLAYPEARARTSKTLLLEPGAAVTGDGVVLELNGLIVEVVEPSSGETDGEVFPVRARVRMLCSCPTEPDGLWRVERVRARLLDGAGAVVAEAPLVFSGETSVYQGKVRAPAPGSYTLEVLAADPSSANFGRASAPVYVGEDAEADRREPTGSAAAPAELDPRVARYLRPYAEMDHFAGVVLVARGDDVLVHRALGLADRELGVSFTTETRLRVGSITKDFTAALVLALEDEGLLSTDDPLSRFLPDFPNGDRILVQHLLTHRHGVPSWRDLPDAEVLGATGVSLEEAVEILAREPLQFDPGSERRYGSSGYLLLARVVENATGESYGYALRSRILDPTGMRATGSLRGLEIVPGLAEAYVPTGAPPWLEHYPPDHPAITVGSASAFSSALDLFRWSRSEAAARLGWGQSEQHGRPMLWTSGLTAGFVARVHRFPDEDVTLVLMSNVFLPAFRPVLRDLAGMVFGEPVAAPRAWTPVVLPARARALLTGSWECDGAWSGFRIGQRGSELFLEIDGSTFPLVPAAPDRLFLPTDYAELRFLDARPDGFGRIQYDGGFTAECTRAR